MANPTLVQVFCEQLSSDSMPKESSTLEWNVLDGRLERRESLEMAYERQGREAVDRCMEKYQEVFEEGEFILQGKEYFDSMLSVKKVDRVAPTSQLMKIEIKSSPLGGIPLGFIETEMAPQVHELFTRDEENLRSNRYRDMWRSFLNRLHKKMELDKAPKG